MTAHARPVRRNDNLTPVDLSVVENIDGILRGSAIREVYDRVAQRFAGLSLIADLRGIITESKDVCRSNIHRRTFR